MKELEIGTLIYHPCSLDILEFKIIGQRKYEKALIYEMIATHNVGVYEKIEVLVSQDKNNNLRFIGYIEDWKDEYKSGLEDFLKGKYYSNKQEARLSYYELQRTLILSNVEEQKRLYENAKLNYNKVEKTLEEIRKEIHETKK